MLCIDFRDLNSTTPKDEYPMPIPDMFVHLVVGNTIFKFIR